MLLAQLCSRHFCDRLLRTRYLTPASTLPLVSFCGAVGVLLAGPAIDLLGSYHVAFLATPCAFAVVVPTLMGWHGEARLP
eukprot:COSAG04_NODE_20_length_39202_cov_9.993530_20_plen_80_part_00